MEYHRFRHLGNRRDQSSRSLRYVIAWRSCNSFTERLILTYHTACFPTIGPAFRYIFGRFLPQSTNKSSSKGYGSHLPNGATNLKSIKLSTVTKSRLHDEEGSTYQLADSVHGNNSTKGGFEAHALDRRTGNTRTVITGNDSDETLSELKEGYTGGIAVKRETEVSVTDASD